MVWFSGLSPKADEPQVEYRWSSLIPIEIEITLYANIHFVTFYKLHILLIIWKSLFCSHWTKWIIKTEHYFPTITSLWMVFATGSEKDVGTSFYSIKWTTTQKWFCNKCLKFCFSIRKCFVLLDDCSLFVMQELGVDAVILIKP